MPPENKPPFRPRPPSHSDLKPVLDQTPEEQVVEQRRFDAPKRTTLTELPAARQPERKQTFTGLGATKPPPLPWNKTVRAPSPPPLVAASRRTDPPVSFGPPPMGIRVPPDEKPSAGPPSVAPEIAARLAKLAEYERRERVQIESRGPGPYQPPLRSQSPVPSSAPAKDDAAIGRTARIVLGKIWPLFVAAAGIGGGATAVLKPGADPAKAEATLANTEAIRQDFALMRTQLDGVLNREATRDDFATCLYEQQADYFAQLLPSNERLGAAGPLRQWVDRCKNRKP